MKSLNFCPLGGVAAIHTLKILSDNGPPKSDHFSPKGEKLPPKRMFIPKFLKLSTFVVKMSQVTVTHLCCVRIKVRGGGSLYSFRRRSLNVRFIHLFYYVLQHTNM